MTFEATYFETIVKYIICHDHNVELAFKVTIEPIGALVHITVIQDNYFRDLCTVVRVYHVTDPDVQVSFTWA